MQLVIRYTLFAVISTSINVGTQYISFALYSGFLSLYIAMAAGTLAGLVTKYVLDKKFIFFHTCETRREDAQKFFLYSFMGVFTTLIFWGVEITFHHLFEGEWAKYAGAVVGLSMGYYIKYNLDKRYVFKDKQCK